ncbi:hypothetical protein FGO68_gene10193 [Halteria grandinella]|uniref:Uncharacterized protein n=1 Tax=Halteria grandinella TaxID=5974 RepID=A0A8J8NVN2_HALGN|nr:hypothetical protein FGO68_gene10193 [Halteria grandinella]
MSSQPIVRKVIKVAGKQQGATAALELTNLSPPKSKYQPNSLEQSPLQNAKIKGQVLDASFLNRVDNNKRSKSVQKKKKGFQWLLPFGEMTATHIIQILSATNMRLNPDQHLKKWSLNGQGIGPKQQSTGQSQPFSSVTSPKTKGLTVNLMQAKRVRVMPEQLSYLDRLNNESVLSGEKSKLKRETQMRQSSTSQAQRVTTSNSFMMPDQLFPLESAMNSNNISRASIAKPNHFALQKESTASCGSTTQNNETSAQQEIAIAKQTQLLIQAKQLRQSVYANSRSVSNLSQRGGAKQQTSIKGRIMVCDEGENTGRTDLQTSLNFSKLAYSSHVQQYNMPAYAKKMMSASQIPGSNDKVNLQSAKGMPLQVVAPMNSMQIIQGSTQNINTDIQPYIDDSERENGADLLQPKFGKRKRIQSASLAKRRHRQRGVRCFDVEDDTAYLTQGIFKDENEAAPIPAQQIPVRKSITSSEEEKFRVAIKNGQKNGLRHRRIKSIKSINNLSMRDQLGAASLQIAAKNDSVQIFQDNNKICLASQLKKRPKSAIKAVKNDKKKSKK